MGRRRLIPFRTAAWIWLAGATAYLGCEAIAAATHPGYNGSLFLVGAISASRSLPVLGWAGWSFVLAVSANAVGNVLVGLFRSGVSAHTVGAGLAIVGGNVAVIIAGLGSRRVGASSGYRGASIVVGAVGLACLLALITDGANGTRVLPVGVVERGSVYSIVVWEIMTGVAILLRIRRADRR